MIRAHGALVKGNLPFSGGSLEQPNAFNDAMDVIDQVNREHEEALRKD